MSLKFRTVSDKINWAREQLKCTNCGDNENAIIYCKAKRWPEDTENYLKAHKCVKCGNIEIDWDRLNRALKYIVDNRVEGLE